MPLEKIYDAFLSYNSRDRALVMKIGEWLADEKGMQVWLDKWNLVPADPWQEELERALDQSKACVVFIGPNNMGPWQHEEMRSALDERVSKKTIRVVPVLLPGATKEQKESELPRFLRRLTWVEFGQSVAEEEARHHLVCGIKGIAPGRRAAAAPALGQVCPFRGLEVFREKDASFFFGREAVVQRLTHHINSYHFLAVIGPSGSGKSSIVQAGIIPALKPTHPLVVIFTPRNQPLTELASALHAIDPQAIATEVIEKRLFESEYALYYITRELAEAYQAREGKQARVLIVVDQFEELFTQTAKEEERKQFIALLLKTKEKANGKSSLVITMRSDFIGKCALYPDLNTFVNDHFIQVGPMSQEELRRAIEEPPRLVNLRFEAGLVDQIIEDVKGASGELPLLEYALLELYNRRKGGLLTYEAYQEIGGVEGALVKRAEEEYNRLDEKRKEILRRMFVLRLVQPGEGTEDTRRRATREELAAIGRNRELAEALINHWSGAEVRMLTAYQDQDRKQEYIDVAHEALIRKWGKIKEWLAEDRQESLLLGKLRQAASEWKVNHEDSAYLYQGTRLLQIEEFLQKHQADLTHLEEEFVLASITQREKQQKHEEERRQKELEAAQELAEARKRELEDIQKLAAARQIDLRKSKWIVGIALVSIVALGTFAYLINSTKKDALHQLARNYWANGLVARNANDFLAFIHFVGGAISNSKVEQFTHYLLINAQTSIPSTGLCSILQHDKEVLGAAFNRDGTRIITWSEDGTAGLWNAQTGQRLVEIKQSAVGETAFNKEGNRLLTWSEYGTAGLWNAQTGQRLVELSTCQKFAKSLRSCNMRLSRHHKTTRRDSWQLNMSD